MKRQITQLERQVTLLSRRILGARPEVTPDSAPGRVRFSAKGLHAQRSRLKLSATDFGRLLGVSSQTIYNWEREAARPRSEQLGKLAALRGIGTREARNRLEQLAGANGKSGA